MTKQEYVCHVFKALGDMVGLIEDLGGAESWLNPVELDKFLNAKSLLDEETYQWSIEYKKKEE